MVTTMELEVQRDWMVVAPWWRWTDPALVPPGQPVTPDTQKGRLSHPVFQKYDSPNLVNDFIQDPQRSLKFVDDDLVHSLRAAVPAPGLRGLPRRTSNFQYLPDGTNTRKIFLPTHKRFYLVVCEVHCDAPGFPMVERDNICEAGFVVRRRTLTLPSAGIEQVRPILKQLAASRAKLTRLTSELPSASSRTTASSAISSAQNGAAHNIARQAQLESLRLQRTSVQTLLETEKARLREWIVRFGVMPQLQGWFKSPNGFDRIGYWSQVEETPVDLRLESTFPLYPLIPSSNDRSHAGNFATVYFGLLPTMLGDTDRLGRARFDDQELYEIRCYVRRDLTSRDRDQPCRCADKTFWSPPTAPYKLASHFDLTGTSNKPVTIQLPDLQTLAAQAKPSLGVAFAKPDKYLSFASGSDGKPQNIGRSSGFQICSFALPLITIVATFLLELFLPVVTILFQLWWMLALKFCIPPEITVAGGVNAEIALDASLSFEASIEANVDASINANFGAEAEAGLAAQYAPIALANMEVKLKQASDPATAPSPTAQLDFEPEVAHA
jgi:hypothetical protein